jgi:hypothetical protein
MQKECSKCHKTKDTTGFIKDKKKKDGLYSSCKECNNKRIAYWHKEHNEEFAEYQREWGKKNRDKVTAQQNKWRYSQPKEYHIVRNISYRFKIFLKERGMNKTQTKNIEEALGCTKDELIKHLESKFQPGMSWGNYGKDGWEIDHIKPLAAFDWNNSQSLKDANHYTNLQPLWFQENRSKSGKWTPDTIEFEEE